MHFTCSFVDVIVPKGPMPDTHVMAGMAAKIELHDERGKLVHSKRVGDLPLGFDSTVTPGEFYEQPHLFHRYYCEGIDGDSVRWTMVESYQHGHLVQVTFTQKLKYAKHYVPIVDEDVRIRLKSMLAYLKRRK